MSQSMNALFLAGVLSLAVASAAQAAGNGGANGGDVRSHASATPACSDKCPVLAGDGGPGGINDGNGRSSAALSQGGAEFLVASIKPGTGDF